MAGSLAEAFKVAGVVSPEIQNRDRLRDLAIDAWAKFPGRNADGARREFVTDALRHEMSWLMVFQWDKAAIGQAIGFLLSQSEHLIRSQKPVQNTVQAVGGGHWPIDTQVDYAPAKPSRDDARPQAERRSEPASRGSAPRHDPPARSNLTVLADKQAARAVAAAATAIRLSRLDTVMIGGKPIGDCTVGEVKAWAEQRQNDARQAGRDARFALALVANLPSGAVIREWWKTGGEVDALYAQAEAEHAA